MILSLPNLSLGLGIIALILSVYSTWQSLRLAKIKKTFFTGTTGIDLESVILLLKEESKESQDRQDALEQVLIQLQKTLSLAVQKVGLVRFNPFSDGGGNFSFSLAMLDAQNTGVVVTSMYGREQNRIYTKKIENGKCESQLTDEEQQAVNIANKK
jgi:hypothetical protein